MKILDRYIYTKTTLYFLIILPSFTLVSGFIELIELLRKVKDVDLKLITLYILLKMPENSYYIVPISLLVATFIVILDLKRSREIYPILTNGIPINYLNSKFLLLSIAITFLQLVNLELVMPKTVPAYESIYLKLKNGLEENPKVIAYNLWLRLKENSFLYFDIYDFSSKTGKGLLLIEFDDELKPIKRVEAKSFSLEGKTLTLENSRLIEINSMSEININEFKETRKMDITISAKDIYRLAKSKKPVSLTDIYKVATLAKKYGYESSYLWSKLFQKLATLISPLVLTLFSISFFWEREYYKVSIGFLSIIVYWYGTALITTISEGGKIPYISIFSVDFVFLLVGYIRLKKTGYTFE